ncbi:MAG: hypothetical protein KDK07_13165 [Bauldia sp.]|nr:hypothetical protein [Bauldia sp.]
MSAGVTTTFSSEELGKGELFIDFDGAGGARQVMFARGYEGLTVVAVRRARMRSLLLTLAAVVVAALAAAAPAAATGGFGCEARTPT